MKWRYFLPLSLDALVTERVNIIIVKYFKKCIRNFRPNIDIKYTRMSECMWNVFKN